MDERFLEQASRLEADRRADAQAAAQRALARQGTEDCEDCGAVIPPARRAAAPFATRCVDCQARAEHLRHSRGY